MKQLTELEAHHAKVRIRQWIIVSVVIGIIGIIFVFSAIIISSWL